MEDSLDPHRRASDALAPEVFGVGAGAPQEAFDGQMSSKRYTSGEVSSHSGNGSSSTAARIA